MEIFGHAVAQGVHSGIQRTYTETMKSYVLPAYEKANAELFKQLHDLFSKGAIGFTKQLSTYTQMYEPIHNELLNLMRSVPEQLRSLNDATVTTCTQKVTNEVNKDLKMLQTNLLKTLKDNIKSEVSRSHCLSFRRSFHLSINFCFRLNAALSRRQLRSKIPSSWPCAHKHKHQRRAFTIFTSKSKVCCTLDKSTKHSIRRCWRTTCI